MQTHTTQEPPKDIIELTHQETGLSYNALFWIIIVFTCIYATYTGFKNEKKEKKKEIERMRQEWFKKKGITEEEWLKNNKK